MADDWKLCADWLVRCEMLSRDHPAATFTGQLQLQNLASALRDGVLICLLLNKLRPTSIDTEDICLYPQIAVQIVLCLIM